MAKSGDSKANTLSLAAKVWAVILLLGTNGVNTWCTAYINRLERPSALVGAIEDPPGSVTITLDNGTAVQTSDDVSGWFRFEDLHRGQHHLRFEADGFHPLPVAVRVLEPDDNYLLRRITLTSEESGTAPGAIAIGVTAIPMFSRTGASPMIDRGSLEQLAEIMALARPQSGWVYLGSFDDRVGQTFDAAVDVSELQQAGSNELVLIWDGPPERELFRGYRLGTINSVAELGADVTVEGYKELGDGQVWAELSFVQPREDEQVEERDEHH